MTHEQIFKNAEWIECTGSDAPVFRKTFNAVKGEKAEIIICGLGYFKLFINGPLNRLKLFRIFLAYRRKIFLNVGIYLFNKS